MILVLDVGTSLLKGGVFNTKAHLIAKAEAPIKLISSENPLYHEVDPDNWISTLSLISVQLGLTKLKKLESIVVSGNGPTLVPVGIDGSALDSAMTWMDRRGIEEAKEISRICGYYVDPSFYLPKAYWIYRNKPNLYKKTRYFLSCPDFMNFHLTGVARTNLPAKDFTRYIWSEQIIKDLDMDTEKFPPFVKPGEIVGKVKKEIEQTIGIREGIPVIAGGPDFIMSLLGTATICPGRACDRSGTSEGINLCSHKPVRDSRLMTLPHVIEGYHNISGIITASGKALEWFKTISGKKELDYETLFEDICDIQAGSKKLLFLPYLVGERAPIWDPNARGAFIGLTLNHGRREMTRAVVESVGYAMRDVITVMEEDGLKVEELRVTGSQAKSPLWNQIKADITGKKILVPEHLDSELFGGLCIALYGLRYHNSLSEASEKMVTIRKTYLPQTETKKIYDELFSLYRESYRGLKGVFEGLSHIPDEERP